MPRVRCREDENPESALRRFKRASEKDGLGPELRAREYYRKPTAVRKGKKAAAVKREEKRRLRSDIRLSAKLRRGKRKKT